MNDDELRPSGSPHLTRAGATPRASGASAPARAHEKKSRLAVRGGSQGDVTTANGQMPLHVRGIGEKGLSAQFR
ncbi:hypothetical protein [Paraburkholderia sp. J41]|uniref:hypothetical protein n=1 Tax=Paraburkholderia sp. J41 TaxID=2805433 RepID=UPI002AC3661D|nr:hypothetical protein [Paraburkholderia sp. J41]